MSMMNPGALVLILNETRLPLLTLMSLAKPWSVASPLPWMSHSLCGLPGRAFSVTIGLLVVCASSVGRMALPPAASSTAALIAPHSRTTDRRVERFIVSIVPHTHELADDRL